jgi:hypothetical protein
MGDGRLPGKCGWVLTNRVLFATTQDTRQRAHLNVEVTDALQAIGQISNTKTTKLQPAARGLLSHSGGGKGNDADVRHTNRGSHTRSHTSLRTPLATHAAIHTRNNNLKGARARNSTHSNSNCHKTSTPACIGAHTHAHAGARITLHSTQHS